MTIYQIKAIPTVYEDAKTGKTHESLLRCYHVLQKVKEMLQRGDSAKTILEVIDECYTVDKTYKLDSLGTPNLQQ